MESDCTILVSLHLDTLLQERFEQVVGGFSQSERLDDVEFSKPDGKSSLVERGLVKYARGVSAVCYPSLRCGDFGTSSAQCQCQ